jgi:hypothetical protein
MTQQERSWARAAARIRAFVRAVSSRVPPCGVGRMVTPKSSRAIAPLSGAHPRRPSTARDGAAARPDVGADLDATARDGHRAAGHRERAPHRHPAPADRHAEPHGDAGSPPPPPTKAPARAPAAGGFDPGRYLGQGDRDTCGDFASQARA